MKSKSIVFFFSVLCLFLSHCTNVGSYYPNRYEKTGILNYEIEISILERRINDLEMEVFTCVTKNKETERTMTILAARSQSTATTSS